MVREVIARVVADHEQAVEVFRAPGKSAVGQRYQLSSGLGVNQQAPTRIEPAVLLAKLDQGGDALVVDDPRDLRVRGIDVGRTVRFQALPGCQSRAVVIVDAAFVPLAMQPVCRPEPLGRMSSTGITIFKCSLRLRGWPAR